MRFSIITIATSLLALGSATPLEPELRDTGDHVHAQHERDNPSLANSAKKPVAKVEEGKVIEKRYDQFICSSEIFRPVNKDDAMGNVDYIRHEVTGWSLLMTRPGPGYCKVIACNKGATVKICNDHPRDGLLVMSDEIADATEAVLNECPKDSNNRVSGQVFSRSNGQDWNIIVEYNGNGKCDKRLFIPYQ